MLADCRSGSTNNTAAKVLGSVHPMLVQQRRAFSARQVAEKLSPVCLRLTQETTNTMPASGPNSSPAIGFLTVCEHEGQGLFGGYLVLNSAARPLEFYCTAPVRPNRAQEILYGLTLKPYLYGEQIGRALLQKAKARPIVVFTDVEHALAVRQFSASPIAYVIEQESTNAEPDEANQHWRLDDAHQKPRSPVLVGLHCFSLGERRLAVPEAYENDEREIAAHWQPYATTFDLSEPFDRIREAIDEARASAK